MSLPTDYDEWKRQSREWRRRARELVTDTPFEPRTRPRDADEADVLRELGLDDHRPFAGLHAGEDPATVIRRLRTDAGLTQVELAARLGVSQQQVNRVEDPRRSNPTWETLEAIAAALGKRVRLVFD